jgi:hypothetical protein
MSYREYPLDYLECFCDWLAEWWAGLWLAVRWYARRGR